MNNHLLCIAYFSVNIACTNWLNLFEISNSSLKKFHPIPVMQKTSLTFSPTIPYNWEILFSFFKQQNMVPNWIDTRGMVGIYNKTSGKWNGAVGKVIHIAI